MNKSVLKSLIRECFVEIMNESRNMDPSKEEMVAFLQTTPYKSEDGFSDSAEVAMYWFANDYHGGQASNLYSVLSTSPYRPSRLNNGGIEGEKDDFIAQELYQELVDKYFPGHSAGHEQGISERLNHLGEKEYNTYRGWVVAVKKVDPNAKFSGDKDIGAAVGADGKHIGEWDGAVGSVIVKPESEEKVIIKPQHGKPWTTTWTEFKAANVDMHPNEMAELEKDLNEKGQHVVGGGAAEMFTIIKKKPAQQTIKENDVQPNQENELKRTQSDFEGGKIPRGLTKQPVKVQVKTELKSKDGVPVLKPSQTVDVFFGKRPSHIYVFSEGKWWSLSIQNASKYLTKFKPTPSVNVLQKMSSDGIVSTPLGTRVEPDGTGPNGEPSWLLVMGLI